MPGKYNLTAHKTPRRARKVVAFYGTEPQWLGKLIRDEMRMQNKIVEREEPGTTKYAMAARRVVECQTVLGRFRSGKIEWEPIEKETSR